MNKILLGMAAASAMFIATAANATLIDDFSDGSTNITAIDATVVSDFDSGLSNVIGGTRLVQLNASNIQANTQVNIGLNMGNYSQNDTSGVTSTGTVTWGGADTAAPLGGDGLGGLALTGEYFALNFLSIDVGTVDFVISVTDTGGTTSTIQDTGASLGLNYYSFTDFLGGADFSDVDFISLTINTNGGATDMVLGSIETVPEPSVIALFGLGLVGLGLTRRRMKK